MSINRNPDSSPSIPDGMLERASELNQIVVAISLDGGDRIAQFYAMTPFRPNLGDRIKSEDGIWCKVVDVVFTVLPTDCGHRLIPNVFAVPVSVQ